MQMLRKLMNMINLKWAQKARIHRVLNVRRGAGSHPYLTIREGAAYFHNHPYAESFDTSNQTEGNPMYFQKVELEGMTIEEMVMTFRSMGYTVDSADAERLALMQESALTLMDGDAFDIVEGRDLFAFQSMWYKTLYPIHRVLTTFEGDVDTAIEQLLLPSARGDWLDYWASFFRIRRLPDETDDQLLRRVILTLTSAKSNNMAMEELIGYYIGTETQVLDAEPAQIEVRVDPSFMDSADRVRDIIVLLKGAGIDYFLNYQKGYDEMYRVYYRDRHGQTFGTLNESYSKVEVTLPVYEEDYLFVPLDQRKGFILNTHQLNRDRVLSRPDVRIIESAKMTMTDANGNIIQQM